MNRAYLRPLNGNSNVVNVRILKVLSVCCQCGVIECFFSLSLNILPSPKEASYYFVYLRFDNSRFTQQVLYSFYLILLLLLLLYLE